MFLLGVYGVSFSALVYLLAKVPSSLLGIGLYTTPSHVPTYPRTHHWLLHSATEHSENRPWQSTVANSTGGDRAVAKPHLHPPYANDVQSARGGATATSGYVSVGPMPRLIVRTGLTPARWWD